MTRPSASSLVLDGNEVKLRLQAERVVTGSPVHIDWVRFTVIRRNAPFVHVDRLFPQVSSVWDEDYRRAELARVLKSIPDPDFEASAQALELAEKVAAILGSDFSVPVEMRKGHDFYRFRWSIERGGAEVGWVGFLSSGDSPRQQAQAKTLHCNLYGAACTFASENWNLRLADFVEACDGDLTRCDLALDFFDGFRGGMERVQEDYRAGVMNSGGKRLKTSVAGDWPNGHERSFYIGSKEAGKQTNVYEKGDQLYGREAGSQWLRIELRYGNKLRELPADMLRRPADFFAGASDWHAAMLAECGSFAAPEPVRTSGRLAVETVEAEVTRNLRWLMEVAAPSVAAGWDYLGEQFLELVTNKKRPGRLQRFSPSELGRAFPSVMGRFFTTAEGAGPAFA